MSGFGTSARVSNAAVSVGSTLPSLNPLMFKNIRDPNLGIGLSVSGSEQIGYASVYGTGSTGGYAYSTAPSTNSTGYTIMGPTIFTTGQLATFAQMYSMYRFKSIAVRYIPSVGTSTSSSLVMSLVFDPLGSTTGMASPITYSMLTLNTYSVQTTAWKPVTLRCASCPHIQNAYWCDPASPSGTDTRTVDQVMFYCLADNTSVTMYGRFVMDYVVEFFSRTCINTAPLSSFKYALNHPSITSEEKELLMSVYRKMALRDTLAAYPPNVMKVDLVKSAGNDVLTGVTGAVPVAGSAGSGSNALRVVTTFPDTVSTAFSGEFSQIPVTLSAPLPTVDITGTDVKEEEKYREVLVSRASVPSVPTPSLRKGK